MNSAVSFNDLSVVDKHRIWWQDHLEVLGGKHGKSKRLRNHGHIMVYGDAIQLVFHPLGAQYGRHWIKSARQADNLEKLEKWERLIAANLRARSSETYAGLHGVEQAAFVAVATAWGLFRGMDADECTADPLYESQRDEVLAIARREGYIR